MSRNSRGPAGSISALAVVVAIALAGCRTAAQDPRPVAGASGHTSYEAVLEPGSSATRLVSQREFIPAAPTADNAPPVYPEELLALALPRQEVILRLVLDERGRIAEIKSSDSSCEVDGRFRDVFEAAIRDAVREWRFSPAVRRKYADAPDDGSGLPPYKVLQSEAPTRTYFDIRFVFEIRDGRGVVQAVR